jgi:hypothetical protein
MSEQRLVKSLGTLRNKLSHVSLSFAPQRTCGAFVITNRNEVGVGLHHLKALTLKQQQHLSTMLPSCP